MASFKALPDELVARIVDFLPRKALAQARLTNKRLERISVEKLFERVSLYPHWQRDDDDDGSIASDTETDEATSSTNNDVPSASHDQEVVYEEVPEWAIDQYPGPRDNRAKLFRNILDHQVLRSYVKEVQVYTCESHCDHHPALAIRWYDGFMPVPEYTTSYYQCIQRLSEFPNMRSVAFHFDRHAGDDMLEDILQFSEFQPAFLGKILPKIPWDRVTELAIRHYENGGRLNPKNSVLFNAIAVVNSLRLSIKHEETHPDGGPTYRVGNIHSFWETFPSRILRPAESNLTNLVLYSDLPFGWFPKLNLRSIYFPKLTSLTLGQYVFHDIYQVNWIILHGNTLKELNLDRCSILYQIGYSIQEWLDHNGYPRPDPPAIGSSHYHYGVSLDPVFYRDNPNAFAEILQFKSIDLRWYEILPRFAEELPKLEVFRFGSSTQWKHDTESRYVEDGGCGDPVPIMPWEDETNLVNRMFEERYLIWDDWQQKYRSHWATEHDSYYEDEWWKDEWTARFESFPACEEDDMAALHALLKQVKYR